MEDFTKMIDALALKLHLEFVNQNDEPMNGDDIADAVSEFEYKLKELSGDLDE